MIKLLLVEDQTIVRASLKRLLDAQPDLQVVGEAENGQVALDRLATLKPDIVLMDVRMPVMDGVTATKLICDRFPQTKVLILTTFDEDEYIAQAMEFGATGYLLKDTPAADLAHAIRTVYQGYTQLAPGLLKKAIAQKSPPLFRIETTQI